MLSLLRAFSASFACQDRVKEQDGQRRRRVKGGKIGISESHSAQFLCFWATQRWLRLRDQNEGRKTLKWGENRAFLKAREKISRRNDILFLLSNRETDTFGKKLYESRRAFNLWE